MLKWAGGFPKSLKNSWRGINVVAAVAGKLLAFVENLNKEMSRTLWSPGPGNGHLNYLVNAYGRDACAFAKWGYGHS